MKSKKTANILPLVMWRKFDIDFFDFKGVIYPFGINIWIEVHLFLLIGE